MELSFAIENAPEANSDGRVKNTRISEGIFLVKVENPDAQAFRLRREIDKSLIQFYFAAEGSADFLFNEGRYRLPLQEGKSLLFYNPEKALPLDIAVKGGARLAFLYITVENLHRLLVAESEEIAFLNQENIHKKFYTEQAMTPAMSVVVNQLFQSTIQGPARPVYEQAKVLEIFALYFNREEGTDVEQCPFLKDEENVERIRQAKQILVNRISDPPTVRDLAREIGLNEYRLKEGFKNIYGKTVFQFLNDYRLDTARHILDQGQTKVNDAAFEIGYSNPSHFIAAFRKKFGVTPKKYLMNQ